MFQFTKLMFSVYNLTNFTVTLFTWTSPSISGANCQLILQGNSSLQLENLPKSIHKSKCHENEIDTIFKAHACLRSTL